MRPTFLGFETARKSIMASQKALDITGNNIANTNTIGYTRQRADLFSVVTPSSSLYSAGANVGLSGQGVSVSGIAQIRDPFIDKRYRSVNSEAMDAGIRVGILTDLENILDNTTTDGIQKALLTFSDALSSFSTDNADRIELASILTQRAAQVINTFNSYSKKLADISEQTQFEIKTSVGDINATLEKIAQLNKQIVDSYIAEGETISSVVADYTVNNKYGPNELLDARNVLIDSLSSHGNIDIINQPDGSVTVKFGNTIAVEGSKANPLYLTEEPSTGAISVRFNSGETLSLTSGSLKGYLDMYNGNGPYAEGAQSGEEGIQYYRKVIDQFAAAFADAFNKANVDPDDPTADRTLFVSSDGSPINGSNIRLNQNWIDDAMSIFPSSKDGELDNTHIFKLMSVLESKVTFGEKNEFTGSFQEYISYFSNKLGQEIEFQGGVYDSSLGVVTSLMDARDSISGVSVEEEGINMMSYQKWFNASARLMTTLDEALNTIINNMGLVGR